MVHASIADRHPAETYLIPLASATCTHLRRDKHRKPKTSTGMIPTVSISPPGSEEPGRFMNSCQNPQIPWGSLIPAISENIAGFGKTPLVPGDTYGTSDLRRHPKMPLCDAGARSGMIPEVPPLRLTPKSSADHGVPSRT